MSVQIAITRRVRAGCEVDFQRALKEFFGASFAHGDVLGASLIVPPPGSDSRAYGVLRTFADETGSANFYASALFKQWEERVRPLTEGEPVRRQLHGLEAWFRGSNRPPPRWKMAVTTFGGVYCLTLVLTVLTGPLIGAWPLPVRNAAYNLLVVAGLTWVVMPFLTRHLSGWLNPQPQTQKVES
jgi:uncharacterized protein